MRLTSATVLLAASVASAQVNPNLLKMQANPKVMQAILSTNLCLRKDDEQEARDNLEAAKIRELDAYVLRIHQEYEKGAKIAQERANVQLRGRKLKPLACDHELVQELSTCYKTYKQCPTCYGNVSEQCKFMVENLLNSAPFGGGEYNFNFNQNESRRRAITLEPKEIEQAMKRSEQTPGPETEKTHDD